MCNACFDVSSLLSLARVVWPNFWKLIFTTQFELAKFGIWARPINYAAPLRAGGNTLGPRAPGTLKIAPGEPGGVKITPGDPGDQLKKI